MSTVSAIIAGIGTGIWWLAWRLREERRLERAVWVGPEPSSGMKRLSAAAILIWLAPKIFIFQPRSVARLVTSGLSLQNGVQLLGIGVVCVWAFWLLYTRRVRWFELARGAGYWLWLLMLIYVASSAWSVWVPLTVLRAVELSAVTICASHAFLGRGGMRYIIGVAFSALLMYAAFGALSALTDGAASENGFWFGLLRSNLGAVVAGFTLLMSASPLLVIKRYTRMALISVCALLLWVFGSVASLIFLLVSLVLLHLSLRHGVARTLTLAAMLALLIVAVGAFSIGTTRGLEAATSVAQFFGKSSENLGNLTGRIPLWDAMIAQVGQQPLGYGFSAGDRLFVLRISSVRAVGWAAPQAHSGYFSALIGGGWLALSVCIALFAGALAHALEIRERRFQATTSILILFLALSNLTTVGPGGEANVSLALLIGTICLIETLRSSFTDSYTGRYA